MEHQSGTEQATHDSADSLWCFAYPWLCYGRVLQQVEVHKPATAMHVELFAGSRLVYSMVRRKDRSRRGALPGYRKTTFVVRSFRRPRSRRTPLRLDEPEVWRSGAVCRFSDWKNAYQRR